MDDRETSINMAQETGLETRKMLGVLWPVPVYTQIVGEAPKPEQLSSINIAGAQISGVLRDAKHGNPTGPLPTNQQPDQKLFVVSNHLFGDLSTCCVQSFVN